MQNLVRELFDFTGRELHEASWQANLPLHNGVALHSFFEAFRDYGELRMSICDRDKTSEFSLLVIKKRQIQNFIKVSYDNILDGWKNSFRASPSSLVDSIYQVYDQIGEEIRKSDKSFFYSEELGWFERFREKGPDRIKKSMKLSLLEYFKVNHEGILLPYTQGNSGNFDKPKIFSETLKDFPLAMLQNTRIDDEVDHVFSHVGPCPEYLMENLVLETPSGESREENYYPSESALVSVFLGTYLHKLAAQKNYPAWNDDDSLKNFISRGTKALKKLPAQK